MKNAERDAAPPSPQFRLVLGLLAGVAVLHPTRSLAEKVSEVQPAAQWEALGVVTAFHRVVHKKSGVEIRLLEADGSETVAYDPVTLFLVARTGGTSERVQRIWRVPREVARVRALTATACGADVRVDVDVFREDNPVPGARQTTLRLCFLAPDLTLLPTVAVEELGRKKSVGRDPTSAEVRVCVDAYPRIQPQPRGIVGAVEKERGCGILIAFESAKDMDDFLRWRREHRLEERTIRFVDASGATRVIPLTLEVGGPVHPEPTLGPK